MRKLFEYFELLWSQKSQVSADTIYGNTVYLSIDKEQKFLVILWTMYQTCAVIDCSWIKTDIKYTPQYLGEEFLRN